MPTTATALLALLILWGCVPEEACRDGIDNDYDSLVDFDDEDCREGAIALDTGEVCQDPLTWFADQDSDGFGADDTVVWSCAQPPGFVRDSGDCDDQDPEVHPLAQEVSGDGIDQDCDGLVE